MKIILVGVCVCFFFGSKYVNGQRFSLGALGIGSGTSPLEKFNPRDLAKSTGDAVFGAVLQLPSAIPTPDTIFLVGKNVLAGYPVEGAFKAINVFCK